MKEFRIWMMIGALCAGWVLILVVIAIQQHSINQLADIVEMILKNDH